MGKRLGRGAEDGTGGGMRMGDGGGERVSSVRFPVGP